MEINENPMIDVVMPVYNVAPYLVQSIESVLNQTYKHFRLIIVDDGSTDGSGEICDKYKTNPHVMVVHRENGGLSAARNTGIEHSNAEYIAFIDSDDWIESTYLDTMRYYIQQEVCDIVCVQSCMEFEGLSISNAIKNISDFYAWYSEEAIKNLFCRHLMTVSAWGKLYRRTLFDDLRYPEGHIHEDYPLILPLLLNANRIVTVNKALYHYRQQMGSISRSEYTKKNFDLFRYIVQMKDVCNIYPNLKPYYENFYYFTIKSLLTMFTTKQSKAVYADDYRMFRTIIRGNVMNILRNETISCKDKIKYIAIFKFRK